VRQRYMTKNLGWVTGLLVMACSATNIKDVGDLDAPTGQGGSGGFPGGAGGATVVVPLAGQGGTGGSLENPPWCTGCDVDTLGPAESTPFADKRNTVSANVVDVTSPRLLRGIEATLLITKRTSAAWVVFEELEDQYALRLDEPTKLDPGDGVYRSPPLSLMLEADHRYAFGIYLNAGACYLSDAPETNELSFGTVAGTSLNGGGDYHDVTDIVPGYGQQFAMQLYTSPSDG
jgi:hypothetical protein